MILKVFDVDQGSCNFIKTSTGKSELVDFGGKLNWSPVQHIYENYIYGQLDRLVLTHHHGDHLKDIDNFGSRRPRMVFCRKLQGGYLTACRRSNTSAGQQLAEKFSLIYDSWDGTPADSETSDQAWGVNISSKYLSYEEASSVSNTDGSTVNNCSYVRLYNHNGTKIFLAGDMEKEGMVLLLNNNPDFRSELKGVNILIAPHHGHRSGFCTELFEAMVTVPLSSVHFEG
jgi:competence protein ComEC